MAMFAAGKTTISRMEGWTGRVVARILPPDGEADYEYTRKDRLHRLDPQELLLIASSSSSSTFTKTPLVNLNDLGQASQEALTTDNVSRWTTLDIFLSKEGCQEEHVHMNRASQELATNALYRMELSIMKKLEQTLPQLERKELGTKEKRKKKETITTKQTVYVPSDDGSQVEWNVDGMANGDFWKQVAIEYLSGQVCVTVQIHGTTVPITIDACPPSIVAVRVFDHFDGRVFVGIPLVVDLDLLFASHAIVDWFVGGKKVCSDSVMYTPTLQDIGKDVTVLMRPLRPGHDGFEYQEAYRFEHAVEERPNNAILPLRQEWTAQRDRSDDSVLRVMTFNVLANEKAFMDTREDRNGLYPYCDDNIIKRSRRTPLILHEILAYDADVICLQEVDLTSFENLFQPVLRLHAYQGYYRNKMGTREGVAMFWSLGTFEEASKEDMQSYSIQGLFPKSKDDVLEDWKSMYDVYDFLNHDQELKAVLTKKLGHVVQIASLTRKNVSSGPKKLVVSNTHLFFHSMGHHIRLLQLFAICHKLQKERHGYPLLFCGDFNTTPHTGGVRLLLDKHVPHNHHTAWKYVDSFSWEDEGHEGTPTEENDRQQPPSVHLADSFPILQSGYAEFPVFTHYIADFCGTLDYILSSRASETEPYGLVAAACAPMPPKELIEEHVAMPSEEWPSDHVSLVCDMKFEGH